jgi:hypothetical protein
VPHDVLVVVEIAEELLGIFVDILWLLEQA